jgi:hypothetical protein
MNQPQDNGYNYRKQDTRANGEIKSKILSFDMDVGGKFPQKRDLIRIRQYYSEYNKAYPYDNRCPGEYPQVHVRLFFQTFLFR